jgi:hypothetical protein
MILTYGKKYRAAIHLGMFEAVASNDTIKAKLAEAGFMGVTVTGSGRDRSAEGTWALATREVDDLPPQVKRVDPL